MSWRNVHIALFILLVLASCRKNADRSPAGSNSEAPQKSTEVTSSQDKGETSFNRFEDLPVQDERITSIITEPGSVAAEYYRPPEKIEKAITVRPPAVFYGPGQSNNTGAEKESRLKTNDSRLKAKDFFKFGTISSGIYVAVNIDNDMWNYTDYYYTAGQSIEVYHPAISYSPLSKLLPSLRNSVNFYSINLSLNLYTPTRLTWETVLEDDRPFSSYLILGHKKSSLSPAKKMRMDTEFDLGVIGPYSMGRQAQDFIHDDTPVGWMYQVGNDVVINYSLRLEKGIFQERGLDIAISGGAQAGTLYDNVSGGLFMQLGKTTGRYESIFQTTPGGSDFVSRIRYYANLDLSTKLVVYDATLQGGMFNQNSIYTIPPDEINRYVFTGRLGLGIGLGRYSLEVEQVFLTPEFQGGKHHFWFRIRNVIHLN